MEANNINKRVIDLDPLAVRDETLAELKTEIREQADDDIDSIDILDTVVLDAEENNGLNSHAIFFSTGGDSVE